MTLVAQSGLKHLRGTCCVRQKGRLSFLYLRQTVRLGVTRVATSGWRFPDPATRWRASLQGSLREGRRWSRQVHGVWHCMHSQEKNSLPDLVLSAILQASLRQKCPH